MNSPILTYEMAEDQLDLHHKTNKPESSGDDDHEGTPPIEKKKNAGS